jgi:hypothetical protein
VEHHRFFQDAEVKELIKRARRHTADRGAARHAASAPVSAGCPAGHLRVLLDGLSVFQQCGLLLVTERAASGNGAAGAPMTGMG